MNEPAIPSRIVIGMLIGSLPGRAPARERAEDEALDGEDDQIGEPAHGGNGGVPAGPDLTGRLRPPWPHSPPRSHDGMIDHAGFGVRDYAASKAFYTRALAPLGITLADGADGARAGRLRRGPQALLLARGRRAPVTEVHVAFARRRTARPSTPSTPPRSRPAAPTTAPPACARSTTRPTTAPTCSTPTATTSRPSATRRLRGHLERPVFGCPSLGERGHEDQDADERQPEGTIDRIAGRVLEAVGKVTAPRPRPRAGARGAARADRPRAAPRARGGDDGCAARSRERRRRSARRRVRAAQGAPDGRRRSSAGWSEPPLRGRTGSRSASRCRPP